MPLIRLGGGVTEIRGSTAGNTFSRNKSGAYIRSRTVPTNTRSTAQSSSRNLFSQLSQNWKDILSQAQRDAWSSYAMSIVTKNKLGEPITLTGQLQFIRSNQARLTAGLSLCSDAPTVLSLAEKDPTISMYPGSTFQTIAVYFDDTLSWVSEDGAGLSILQGKPRNLTRNFFNGPYRHFAFIPGSSVNPPSSPYYLYSPPFFLAMDQRIGFVAQILQSDGRCSNPFSIDSSVHSTSAPSGYFLRDNFNCYSNGPLIGQGEWVQSDQLLVQDVVKYEGSKAVSCSVGTLEYCGKNGNQLDSGTTSISLRRDVSFSGLGSQQDFVVHSTDLWSMLYVAMDYNKIKYQSNLAFVNLLSPYVLGTWYRIYMEWRGAPDFNVRYKLDDGAWSAWVDRPNLESQAPSSYAHLFVNGLSGGSIAYFDFID
jgi:hypothetical protein